MKLDEETVYEVTGTPEEQKALMEHNERAKMLHSQRREQEMLEAPGIISKFRAGMAKLKTMFTHKNAIKQTQQNNRQTTR